MLGNPVTHRATYGYDSGRYKGYPNASYKAQNEQNLRSERPSYSLISQFDTFKLKEDL